MKTLPAFCLLLLSVSAPAWAQQTPPCPTLPTNAELQWEQRGDHSYIACKAVTADGRQVLNVMLTSRDPKISLERGLRAEEGNFSGREMYWYRPDLGGRNMPGMESRRITVVKLGKDQYAQVWINAESPAELATLRSLAQQLDVSAASATLLSAGR
ncbi:hypothetical protein OVA13_07230 [Pseudoxanthomonas sp. SL93]|jgi:hypothetical protein|uniref:hypothetical protein n=1 Tax=Pseudoxanthomonas sp. SL93 TaxID=2995142 RepID=UPI0022712886|nr:hypothetical protein [Pseudoxanthomonas sp. SL93]WAC64541.1 hypothetical protein OVA13_07230 [Pseudoxanthomonas sp. SL93]